MNNRDHWKALFLSPTSATFIDASRDAGLGTRDPLENLRCGGHKGAIHVVHLQARGSASSRRHGAASHSIESPRGADCSWMPISNPMDIPFLEISFGMTSAAG
ncbi:MAG: hypothetical protein ACP5M0_09890 [Desulfomonilaceae bacterium]